MKMRRITTLLLCLLLTTAMLFAGGCGKNKTAGIDGETTVMGEGAKTFGFTVTDKDGNNSNFEIHTDKETVGEALIELDLIEGEDGEYGLYVKTVNGITADADKDQAYWAFYANGEFSSYGVDMTDVVDGDSYAFVYQTL